MDRYIPDIYQKSIYVVKYDKLAKSGIKCILFDIDNTLVSHNSCEVSNKLLGLIDSLKSLGIEPILYTECKNRRFNSIKSALNIEGYNHVYKIFSNKIEDVLKKYKEPEIALVTDQMTPDIKFGNGIGITTILVNPISNKCSFITHLKRGKERRIMSKLRANNLFVKGRYYE